MSDTEDLAALNDRLMAKNHALAEALSRAGKELTKAKSQLAQLAQPPLTFATMVKVDSTRTDEDGIQHASAEVISGTRRMVVPVASNVNAARLTAGATVMLNEKLVLVEQRDADTVGQIRSVKQVLDDGRLIVTDACARRWRMTPAIPCSSAVPARSRMRASIRATVLSSIRPSASPSKRCPPRATRIWCWRRPRMSRSPTSAAWIVRSVVSGTPSNCRSSIVRCLSATI